MADESFCANCGTRADVGLIFCKTCGATLRPSVPLVASASKSASVRLPILADTIGLLLVAAQLILVFHWLVPDDGTRFFAGILAYGVLVGAALGMWHGKQASERFSDAHDWVGVVVGSILLGGVSFGVDVLVGSSTRPGMSPIEAGTKAGSPFGFILTIFLCPGITMVALASVIRSFLMQKENTEV
jgi:hypothetical protein